MDNEFKSHPDGTDESYAVNDLFFQDGTDVSTFLKISSDDFPEKIYESEIVKSILNPVVHKTHHLNRRIVSTISKKMGLPFSYQGMNELENISSPVCYADSSEVTDDFKIEKFPQSSSEINVLDYTCGILHEISKEKSNACLSENDLSNVPYPLSQVNFWKWAKVGEALRKQFTLHAQ